MLKNRSVDELTIKDNPKLEAEGGNDEQVEVLKIPRDLQKLNLGNKIDFKFYNFYIPAGYETLAGKKYTFTTK